MTDDSTGLDEADQSTVDTTTAGPDETSSDGQGAGDSSAQDMADGGESGDSGSESGDSSTGPTGDSGGAIDGAGNPTEGSSDASGGSSDASGGSSDASGGSSDTTDGSGDATGSSGDATDSSGDATDGAGDSSGDASDGAGDGSGDATDGAGDSSGDATDGSDATGGSGDATDGSGTGATDGAGQDQAGDTGAPAGSPGEQSGGTSSTSVAADAGPPYLIVDQYPGDSGARPPWEKLVSTAGMCGVILKAWDGRNYDDRGWFATNWPAVREVGGDRYGVSWFRGAYLFVQFAIGGAEQADAYLAAVDRAGGWDRGDIVPIIDVELGNTANPHNTNATASAQQIVDCATQCAERIKSVTGSRVMLYGRGAMRDRSITSHMGCDLVWNPSYTAKMVTNGLQTWPLEDIALWQYCGDNSSALPGYPHSVPGFAKVDISVYVHGAAKPNLDMLRTSLLR